MKKYLSLLLLLVTTTALWAADFEVDGIAYKKIGGDSVEVSSKSPEYSGNITIPATVTYGSTTYRVTKIGDMAFYGDTAIVSVSIGNNVASIGFRPFSNCTSLTSITLPNSVTYIANNAFEYCTSLAFINIPNSVTYIGGNAFYNCTSLPVVGNLRYADTYLVGAVDKSLSTYTIKDGTQWIGTYAFSRCSYLTSITIPHSVTRIGQEAFEECTSLTSITIPNRVTDIAYQAFENCSNLTSITSYATTPPTCGSSCFYNVTTSIPVYVPSESVTAYKAADQWKNFTDIQAIAAEPTIAPDSVITEPTDNSITITWPTTDSTFTYDLVVYDADSNVVCIVSFDANGTMTGITYPAPGRYGNAAVAAEEVSIGYRFTITGLDPGTNYTYAIVYKNEQGIATHTESGAFTTKGSITEVGEVQNAECTMQKLTKVMRDGQLLILRDGRTYNAQGGEVK